MRCKFFLTEGEESIDEARLCVELRETRRVTFWRGNSPLVTGDGAGVDTGVAYVELGGSCTLSGLVRDLRVGGGGGLGCPMDLDLNTLGDVGDRGDVGKPSSGENSGPDVFTGGTLRSGCIGGGAMSVCRVGDAEIGRGSSVEVVPRIRPRSGDREKGEFPLYFAGDRDNRAFATDS